MINRSSKDSILAKLENVSKGYENDLFTKEYEKVTAFKDNYRVKVVFVGKFSAGKSALINRLIGDDLLIEAQKPQTTIATELCYTDGDVSFFAFRSDNSEPEKISIYDQDTINADNYEKAVLYINSDTIKSLEDITVVDTPGYDSGIENHNRALLSYTGMGTAYLYVKDITLEGGLSNIDLKFISELIEYGGSVAVVFNKCDLFDQDRIEEIKENVNITLENAFLDLPVYYVSRNDDNITDELINVISDFDVQSVFDKKLLKTAALCAGNIKAVLTGLKKQTRYEDNKDTEREIFDLNNKIDKARHSFEKLINSNSVDDVRDGIETICVEINSALDNAVPEIAAAVKNGAGKDALSAIVSEVVRPVMMRSMQAEIGRETDNVIDTVSKSVSEIGTDTESLMDVLKQLSVSIHQIEENGMIDRAINGYEKYKSKINEQAEKNDDALIAAKASYQAVTGVLAATTTIVAPWLEVIIILLPDIIRGIQLIFGKSQDDQIRDMVKTNFLPQLKSGLRRSIEQKMLESRANLLTALEEEFNIQMDAMNKEASNLAAKREKSEKDYNAFMTQLDNDIAILSEIIDSAE